MAAQYKIKRSSDKQYYFVLQAGNNEIIATSERYTTKAACLNGIRSVKHNCNAPTNDTTT